MDAEMPPESQKKGLTSAKFWRAVAIGVALFAVLQLLTPKATRCGQKAETIRTVSNARQLGMALLEFKEQYGRFPDASTIEEVKRRTASTWTFGSSNSNDVLKQLLAAGIVLNEEMFHTEGQGERKSDGLFANEIDALAPGECGFVYIPGPADDKWPSRPLAVASVIPGTSKFDPTPFNKKAVVLRCDGTVQTCQIHPDGHIVIPGATDLLAPSQPYWDGRPPAILWPALLPISPPSSSPPWAAFNFIPWVIGLVVLLTSITLFMLKHHRGKGFSPESV